MSHQVIRRFVERVRQQSRSQSRTLNLPMDEAQDLANELALLLLRENELLAEINRVERAAQVTSLTVQGGTFSGS